MKGLSVEIARVFETVSRLDCLKEYTLIGGTALALQIGHRLSEDLDFCKWPLPGKSEVNWPLILNELNSVFSKVEPDILSFNQVNFFADRIKLSFYSNQSNRSPVSNPQVSLNNIKIPDIQTIGVMKLEVMLRRSNFRDYYDIYSILNEGVSLRAMVEDSILYSNRILKTRDILNFISNGNNFKKEKNFELFQPRYASSETEIEKFIKEIIRKEYPLSFTK